MQVVRARTNDRVEGRERGLGLALLGLDLGERQVEAAEQRERLLVLVLGLGLGQEGRSGFLDRGERLFLAVFGEQRRDVYEPGFGPLWVQALGLRQRLERTLR